MKTSDQNKELIESLFAASKELDNPVAVADNPFYKSKYTPLDYLINHIKKVIAKHNLFVVQEALLLDDRTIIITRLYHETGQWLETELGVPAGSDPQKQGASVTYARRYALSALFNIASDMDNDANETVDQLKNMPKDIRQLFIDKGYKDRDAVKSACEVYNYNWNLIKKSLEV